MAGMRISIQPMVRPTTVKASRINSQVPLLNTLRILLNLLFITLLALA